MVKKILFPLLLVFWMGLIFYFSSQNGSESGNVSGVIVDKTEDIIYGDEFDEKPLDVQQSIHNFLTLLVRKGAHFTIFGILGLLAFLSLYAYKKSYLMFIYSGIFSFLYAISDEYHQTLVSGRAGAIKDVLIDTLGACSFLLITFIILLIINKIKKRSNLKRDLQKA